MRVFVYEYLTALGIGRDPADPLHPLYREGRAMRDALAEDFERIPGVEVRTLDGVGVSNERERYREAVQSCDRTLLIAPEFDRVLAERCRWADIDGGRLLGTPAGPVGFVTDKFRTAEHWRSCGIPTPAITDREPTGCETFPLVWKPRDGAGSTATFRLDGPLDVARAKALRAAEGHTGPMILQEFVPGRPVSVAFLCGPAGHFPLVPCAQLLSDDGRFKYFGGEVPMTPHLADRALRLARQAIGCVPGVCGYVGVDLVLGVAADGSRDYTIEINPRPTTSYVGLRALADFNLAEKLLWVVAGESPGEMRWRRGAVRFLADGTVRDVSAGYHSGDSSSGGRGFGYLFPGDRLYSG
jgi:predicted ATP-grasp superfamily ATP-dependent carboligase